MRAICPENGVVLAQDLLHALAFGFALTETAGAKTITMCLRMTASLSALHKRRYSYSSESDEGGRIHHPDKSNTVFATFSTPTAKKSKCTQK
jgi:hypothetical protein